jgi:putative endonuclease
MRIDYFTVYILANEVNTVLYVGITNNILRRVFEHRQGFEKNAFTNKYNLKKLVYYKIFDNPDAAIKYEKKLKGITRVKKNKLITEFNPNWTDQCSNLV